MLNVTYRHYGKVCIGHDAIIIKMIIFNKGVLPMNCFPLISHVITYTSTKWLNMNVIVISGDKVIVEARDAATTDRAIFCIGLKM